MVNTLKERLMKGETLIGSLVTIGSPDVAEIMSHVGYDYLWICTEHSPLDFPQTQQLMQAVGTRCPCLVRVPENKEVWFKKTLDMGCQGVVVPQIKTAAEVRQVLRWCLYPPAGNRSIGVARAHDYGMRFANYVEKANEQLLIVLQVENSEAVDNIASIVKVPGIGALLIGPFDLSASLNVLGEITHPSVTEAMEKVRRHCQEAGVPLGIFTTGAQDAVDFIKKGYRLIALSMDTDFLWRSAREKLHAVRANLS